MRAGKPCLVALLGALGLGAVHVTGCSSGSSGGSGVSTGPIISNVNGARRPIAVAGGTIEINGTGFGATPGVVTFNDLGATTTAAVTSGNWTDTSILVEVPATLPVGSASVTVANATGAVSSESSVDVVATPLQPTTPAWSASTPLPLGLRTHSVVVVRGTNGAFVYVIGGNDGNQNLATVLVAPLSVNGLGLWTLTSSLPAPRSLAAVAVADETNSPAANPVIYVAGGALTATDVPGGTKTVFVGKVNPLTGQVKWTTGSPLLESRVAASAAVTGGSLVVTGGYSATGIAIGLTATAPIDSDGDLGTVAEAGNASLPVPVGLHQTFATNGFVYVVGGNTGPVTDPSSTDVTNASANAWVAPIRQGVVGAWTTTGGLSRPRQSFVILPIDGTVFVYEGAYGATDDEGESAALAANGRLAPFTPITSGLPGLNVFNTGGGATPILVPGGTPRAIIAGGDSVVLPGAVTSTSVGN